MSTSQIHGKVFEREVIQTCFGIDPDSIRPGEMFDIPLGIVSAKHPIGEPVSIKTAAKAIIGLADARRVWSWAGPVMLVLGLYGQEQAVKRFHTVHEFLFRLTERERELLYGSVSYQEVAAFHEELKLFAVGRHAEARRWAKSRKAELQPRLGCIQLNQKIDSKDQRRLQCSAQLDALVQACESHTRHIGDYRGLALPFTIASGSRQFREKSP